MLSTSFARRVAAQRHWRCDGASSHRGEPTGRLQPAAVDGAAQGGSNSAPKMKRREEE